MELLLVVAILAIVAAAAAPTFSGGASDALREARKSAFLAAYQNAVTGAHMMVALGASKGYDAADINLDETPIITGQTTLVMEYYAPVATRQFKNNTGADYTLGAYIDNNHKLFITCNQAKTAKTGKTFTAKEKIEIASDKSSTEALNDFWDSLNTTN